MTDEEPMQQWDEQVETARAAMEQAFKTADEMADRIEALVKERDDAIIKRAAWELEAKVQQARAERLEAERDALIVVLADCPIPQVAEEARTTIARLKGADHE